MNKNEELEDRFTDELLREDARGREADEKLLAALETAMGDVEEVDKVTPLRRERSRAPYAWAALLTLGAFSVAGYFAWRQVEGPGNSSLVTMDRMMESAPYPVDRPGESSALVREAQFEGAEPGRRQGGPEEPSIKYRNDKRKPSGPTPPIASVVANVNPATDSAPRPKLTTVLEDSEVLGTGNSFGDVLDLSRVASDGGAFRGDLKRPMPSRRSENPLREAPGVDRERYGQLVEQPWKSPWTAKFSTFSVDVDTASYTNIRRMLQQGVRISPDAVRIEECLNYFDYQYAPPKKGGPFAVHTDLATCPWAADHFLMKVGIKGMEVPANERPSSNLVFLIDVSGSMQGSAKLPLLVDAMKILVEELDERDRISMVVYAGSEGVVLDPTRIDEEGRGQVLAALNKLRSGGSTNGGAGIQRAYQLAQENFVEGGVNRVILATDGDFNVGTTGQGDLVKMVKARAAKGVYLSVLGFGAGNINDSMLEAITNDGNGNYFYIDSQKEARKVFLQDLSGTLVTIAKDVKIQVDFNPGKVQAYRLIGYANRILRDEDFNDDKVDAGDIGAGHTVTALYEIVPMGVAMPPIGGVDASKYDKPAEKPNVVPSDEWLTVKLRYKRPDGDTSTKLEVPVAGKPVAWEAANSDFQFAAGVALFGMKLRQSEYANDAGWDLVQNLAEKGSVRDVHGYRAEFQELVSKAAGQAVPKIVPMPENGIEAPPAR